ncbi:MAG: tRNA (adenosine(37)-N6)-threonylcarbamoyltransferase complex transferase subunit TsaD, partial [Deltaproteobacteria bacterium]|nr:tRNA (adenosine(37)-N6)-threonylcarbamoyltransferase complex transferase subunit TsaD [Deltaproteobacteria bacterium]
MLVLGIESSCDDLSMSLVDQGRVLANVTATQTLDHAPFGGVVPEIASRRHLESLEPTLELALEKAGRGLDAVEGVAATFAPGLVGSLLVGLNFAKALAYARGLPFRGVHHI